MADAYIIDTARTPRGIGKAGRGALSGFHPGRLLAKVFEAIAERSNLNTDEIDDVVVGCSSQVGKQGSCVGRMAALDAVIRDRIAAGIPGCIGALDDDDPRVRHRAVTALRAFSGEYHHYDPDADADSPTRKVARDTWQAWWDIYERRRGRQ